MADVAREAGVSLMTVSRAIRNRGDISAATRERVLEVAERLGYQPSGIARSLVTRHTGTLGLVMPDVANPFFSDLASGAEDAAYAEGYGLFLCNTNEDRHREQAQLRSLFEKRVDGVIICSSRMSKEQLREAISRFAAVVLVNRRLPGSHAGAVLVDNAGGARLMTEHLLSSGHERVAFLGGPGRSRGRQERLRGYQRCLRASGLTYRAEWAPHSPPTIDGGRLAAQSLLTAYPEVSALFCYNDLVAVGALEAAAELGRKVPETLAIGGFDGIALSRLVTPPLTTCQVNTRGLGIQAMRLLLAQISQDPQGSREVVISPELVVRQSAP